MNRKLIGILLIIVILCCLSLTACRFPFEEQEEEDTAYHGAGIADYYFPEVLISGDTDIQKRINVTYLEVDKTDENGSPIPDESVRYPLTLVLEDHLRNEEFTNVLILSRSTKAVYIDKNSFEYYYFTVNKHGLVLLESTLELHKHIANTPLRAVVEIVICKEGDNAHGLKTVYATEGRAEVLPLTRLFFNYGLFERTHNAIQTVTIERLDEGGKLIKDKKECELMTCNKKIPLSSILLKDRESGIFRLESGEIVKIDRNTLYTMHWANGGLYMTDFKSKVVEVRYN